MSDRVAEVVTPSVERACERKDTRSIGDMNTTRYKTQKHTIRIEHVSMKISKNASETEVIQLAVRNKSAGWPELLPNSVTR